MFKQFFLIGWIIWPLALLAQPEGETLTREIFWEQVRQYHPLARQALLLEETARQELRYARGAFDPQLFAAQEQKTFDGKDYFTHGTAGVKMATLWGPVLKAQYDWTDGVYLNPELQLPAGGQAVLGVELPLLRGLFFDNYRSGLRQAEAGIDARAAQARSLRNALFLESNKTYWDWAWAYQARQQTTQALRYSQERLAGLREGYRQGDYPAVDTLEAFLQVQSWQMERQEAEILLNHAVAQLQAFLWNADGQAGSWRPDWQPVHPALQPPQLELDSLRARLERHPALRAYEAKLLQLQIERRWKAELLKPELTVSFNLLGDQFDFTPGADDGLRALVTDNYKWGVRFSFPLLLRKERAGLALADLKISETTWQLNQKRQELEAKLLGYWQEYQLRRDQVDLAGEMVANYQTLLQVEQTKFQLGESSVFLLNSRQQKLLEAQLKLLKAQAELQKAAVSLQWIVGEE
ncbi:MAG: TolC family protein [Lewinella sp.]|nr:TolC family protein [Lewinella sp.]